MAIFCAFLGWIFKFSEHCDCDCDTFGFCDEDFFCYEVHLHVLLHSRADADLVLHKFDKNGEING